MKNYKRAQRRKKAHFKFEKRIKIWTQGSYFGRGYSLEDELEKIRIGQEMTFLRSTSTPCSCPGMCAYLKYKRVQKQYRFKDEDYE